MRIQCKAFISYEDNFTFDFVYELFRTAGSPDDAEIVREEGEGYYLVWPEERK